MAWDLYSMAGDKPAVNGRSRLPLAQARTSTANGRSLQLKRHKASAPRSSANLPNFNSLSEIAMEPDFLI